MEEIRKIHRRQVARLLDHLKNKNQLTDDLAKDIKRSFGFTFDDVEKALKQENDTEINYDEPPLRD
jgi:hypothetical protein